MDSRATKFAVFVLALGLASWAGPAAIGIATARGSFLVNGSNVSGNATLLEGMTVTSLKATSRLQFQTGATLVMTPDAQVRVHNDHVVLQKGAGELTGSSGFLLEAAGIRIQPSSAARVSLHNGRSVTVAALRGPVKIFNGEGALVTEVESEAAYTFEQDAAAPPSSAGCLIPVGDRFVVLDETGVSGVEVRGAMLSPLVGSRVEVKGRNAACAEHLEGTSRVVQVSEAKNLAGASCANAKDRFVAAHPNISTERHTRKRCKVIAGVVLTGAAAGGITAAVCCRDEKPPVSVQ